VGLTLTFAGLPVLAQFASRDHPLKAPSTAAGRGFVYGTHFYHPKTAVRPDQFRAMLGDIANKYQFNTILIFPFWDYYNPKPGVFLLEDLDRLLTVCDEFHLRAVMSVLVESAPYWLEQAHPETRFVNAADQAVHLGGTGSHYSGGYPGLCFDWPVVRDAAAPFIHALAKMSATHPSLYAYDMWNEITNYVDILGQELAPVPLRPDQQFCYCKATIAEFQRWLRRQYGSLDQLNDAWVRRFPDWTAIDPPRGAGEMYTDWMDWRHFIQDRAIDFLQFRVEELRAVDREHVLETHVAYTPPIGPVTQRGVQPWRVAEVVQAFGTSAYLNGVPFDQVAGEFCFGRSCAGGKDFWITELQADRWASGYLHGEPVKARSLRALNWLAVASGAKAILYGAYLAEGSGREASGFGLVTRGNEPTERSEEAAKTNRIIQARWDLLDKYLPNSQVAVLFDQDNALLTYAGNANEKPAAQSIAGYCKAFWNLDLWVDFIEPSHINESRHKVLVVPWHLIGKKATCDSIRTYAERGGTVILETAFSRFNDKYYFNAVIPGNGLDQAFGYREKDSFAIENGILPMGARDEPPSGSNSNAATLSFSEPMSIQINAHTYLTPVEVISATPIATCHQWTVATMKRVGTGSVYYIGTNLGGSISSGDSGGIELLRAVVSRVVQPPVRCSGPLRPRLIQGSSKALLIIFNDTDADQTDTLTVPPGLSRASDVYSCEKHAIKGNQFEINVAFRSVAVFDLV
jgi:beta-galactosidase GanA